MIQVEWANEEKTIIRWQFPDTWTWHEIYDTQKEVDEMIDTVDSVVDNVLITSKHQHIPSGALSHFQRVLTQRHPRSGHIIIVGSKTFLVMLLGIIKKITPENYVHFVQSEDEALHYIADHPHINV